MPITHDPNSERQCFQRWEHREIHTIEREGTPLCAECYSNEHES